MDYCISSPKSSVAADLSQLQTSERSEPVWFARLLAMLIVMNGLDGLLTLVWVATDRAVEANPLMAILLDIHPVLFMASKCALVSFGALLLWRHREHTLSVISLTAACVAYWMVLTHHWRMIVALAT